MSLFDSLMNDALDFIDKMKSDAGPGKSIADFKQFFREGIEKMLVDKEPAQAIKFFKESFKKAQDAAQTLFPGIWDQWFQQGDSRLDALAQTLCDLADELDDAPFGTLIETLLEKQQDHKNLFQQIAAFCLRDPTEIKKRLAQLWGPLLAATLQALGPEKLTQALLAVMTSVEGNLERKISILDLDILSKDRTPSVLEKILAYPAYQFPAGIVLTGLGLQILLQYSDFPLDVPDAESPDETQENLFAPLKRGIDEIDFKQTKKIESTLVAQVFMGLIGKAQENEDTEWALLKMARVTPVGIFLIISAVIHCLLHNMLPWWNLLFKEIENDPKLKVKRLPAPQPGGPKYLIFSDIHRDAKSDQREPLEFGSIDHFAANQSLYCEILDYAFENGYTVLEAGDCDELWFFRDYSKRPREKLQEIVETHKPVYDRLARLHREGRYFRIYGNHDCYIRNPAVFEILQNIFDKDKAPTDPFFDVCDFAIIDGVKSMDESILNIGLDSAPYQAKAPMIVAHGHQWDFWNCDENNIIGKLIVSAIATPIDFLDDPFVDAGGIAYSGSPVINFADVLANAFILKSFPAYLPSRKLAHRIQHLKDRSRHTIDNIFYLETLAAFTGTTIKVKKDPNSIETRRNNLICLGHTHYPQSQPYFNLKSLIPLVGPLLIKFEENFFKESHGLIKPSLAFVKSKYFNSGTAGWMEGVIWAIQIDETGQARSIYWTRDTRINSPQMMDWELPLMDEELRQKLATRKGSLLNKIEELSRMVDSLLDFKKIRTNRSVAIRFEALFPEADKISPRDMTLDSSQTLADPLGALFLSLLGSGTAKTHTLRIPLPKSIGATLSKMQNFIGGFSQIPSDERARFAGAWFLASRSIPFLGGSNKKLTLFQDDASKIDFILKAALALILQLPGAQHDNFPISSQVSLEGNELVVRITVHPENEQPLPKGIQRSPAKLAWYKKVGSHWHHFRDKLFRRKPHR